MHNTAFNLDIIIVNVYLRIGLEIGDGPAILPRPERKCYVIFSSATQAD